MIGKMEMRLMQRMDSLEARMIAAIGEQQRHNRQMDKVCDPEDSDSPDAKRYTAMLKEASRSMDRQLEEICNMEQGKNIGRYSIIKTMKGKERPPSLKTSMEVKMERALKITNL